ncbi:hypothetical protein SAMN05216312_101339 [Cohnella sp. OV330]|uniref:hypothetical protein n=1 Tax=Cohnella sp. OV330 TaxID=1855288 RepID=UPI0008ED7D56|nr:hypothetical protein [Cohnella sp. OV330]SFA76251.1 hypothetical protein SAMN05216312_101339 [Cohnella sp. OV330]
MSKGTRKIALAVILLLIVYFLFFPSITPQLAVRKQLLISFHPIKAVTVEVRQGKNKHDPKYGDLYEVSDPDIAESFIYVKKSWLGWRVTSVGSGP